MSDEQAEVIRAEVAPVVAQAGGLAVRSAADYAGAGEFLKAIKGAQKRVTDHFGPMKAAAHAAWKTITGKEAETLKPLTEAEALVKRRMIDYQTEQERIRQAEQARLQAEADAAAERERARLEKEAAKLKTPELREARMEAAAMVVAPVVTVAAAVPRVEGQSIRKTWKAVVTDRKALARTILADWVDWEAYVTINQAELDRLAARTKGCLSGVPGLEFREETGIASRGR